MYRSEGPQKGLRSQQTSIQRGEPESAGSIFVWALFWKLLWKEVKNEFYKNRPNTRVGDKWFLSPVDLRAFDNIVLARTSDSLVQYILFLFFFSKVLFNGLELRS